MIVTWRPEFVSEPRCSLLPHIRSAHLLPWIVPGVPGIPQDLPEFGLSLPSDRYSDDVRGCHGFRVATHNDDLTTRCRSPPTHISDSDPEASLSYDSTLPLHHNRPLPRGKHPDFRSTAPRTVLQASRLDSDSAGFCPNTHFSFLSSAATCAHWTPLPQLR